MEQLSKQLKSDDIIVADDGGHLTWAVQGLKIKKNQRLFSAFGNSPMGYALPAAIGASIAKIKKNYMYRWGWKYSNKYTRTSNNNNLQASNKIIYH